MQTRYLDGSNSTPYMRYHKAASAAQGMDIWQDKAFILYDTGICGVYDLAAKKHNPDCVFPLASYNAGKPTKDYLNHANHCMFSTIHHEGNPIPVLYVTIGTGIGYDEDGFFYRCAAENIVATEQENGEVTYTSQLLQTITYHPDGIENTSFMPPCWGCPAFFVDTEKGFLYIFSAKYRTKRGCVPEGEKNRYIITKFPLPELSKGGLVKLTPADILDQFSVESEVPFTQGGALYNGRLYYTYGCPKGGYSVYVHAFNLEEKCLEAQVENMDEAFFMEEVECCGIYKGKFLCNTNNNGTIDDGEGGLYVVQEGVFPL